MSNRSYSSARHERSKSFALEMTIMVHVHDCAMRMDCAIPDLLHMHLEPQDDLALTPISHIAYRPLIFFATSMIS
jgi:hypothetical protein